MQLLLKNTGIILMLAAIPAYGYQLPVDPGLGMTGAFFGLSAIIAVALFIVIAYITRLIFRHCKKR